MSKKSTKPGGGGAFAKLKGKLANKPGVTDPGALAASIGRKEYGNAQFQKMATRGKERATAERRGEKKPPLPKVHKLATDGLSEALGAAASKLKK